MEEVTVHRAAQYIYQLPGAENAVHKQTTGLKAEVKPNAMLGAVSEYAQGHGARVCRARSSRRGQTTQTCHAFWKMSHARP